MGLSWIHIVVVLAVVVLLFGGGKIPRLMGDFAKGIKAFKSGMKDGVEPTPTAETSPSERIADASSAKSNNEKA